MPHYYLGIDVSKGYADFMMLDEQRQPVDKGFQLDDTAAGHLKLVAYLTAFCDTHPQSAIYAAVESTGGYENNWYHRLIASADFLSIHVARLNPARVKDNSKASARRNRTDQISAKDIAEYLITHPGQVRYDEPEAYPMLRRQWTFIQLNLKQKSQLLSHLDTVLYTGMPELLTFCREGVPTWLLKVLQRYPTYRDLQSAGIEKLVQIPYLSGKKAQRIMALIEQGVGNSDPVSGEIIRALATQILTLEQQIAQQKKYLEKHYQEAQREIKLLLSFKGIGVYSAVGLLLSIVSIHRFQTVKHLASYFGIHPVYKQSGDGVWGFHMSKQGRAEPRAILYMVAWSAIQFNPVIKDLYAHCMKKGMNKNAALGVCMHKILRIIYGMLKNNTPFDPTIDQKNREKQQINNQKPKHDKKRRLQQFDKNAPVSGRQLKKRKEQSSSQDEPVVKCGIVELLPSSSNGDGDNEI
jgi:transposase